MLQPERKRIYDRTIDNNRLAPILEDLKYCPMCAWALETVFNGYTLAAQVCPNHGRVFQLSLEDNEYVVTINLEG